jgi:hypothetical protein
MPGAYPVRPEWTRDDDLMNGGLIAIGALVVQAFLSRGGALDLPALVSVLAFAVAMPLLVALILLNHLQAIWNEAPYPPYLVAAHILAQGSAVVGVVAAFWQLSWLAGAVFAISAALAVLLYLGYYAGFGGESKEARGE